MAPLEAAAPRLHAAPAKRRRREEGGARTGCAAARGGWWDDPGGLGVAGLARRRWPRAEEKEARRRHVSAMGKAKGGGGWDPWVLRRVVTRLPEAEVHRSNEGAGRRRGRQRGRDGLGFGSVEKKRR